MRISVQEKSSLFIIIFTGEGYICMHGMGTHPIPSFLIIFSVPKVSKTLALGFDGIYHALLEPETLENLKAYVIFRLRERKRCKKNYQKDSYGKNFMMRSITWSLSIYLHEQLDFST